MEHKINRIKLTNNVLIVSDFLKKKNLQKWVKKRFVIHLKSVHFHFIFFCVIQFRYPNQIVCNSHS